MLLNWYDFIILSDLPSYLFYTNTNLFINWVELAFLAPILYVNVILKIGTDAESHCFLTFSSKEVYIKFIRILALLGIDHT